jgi:hypothetical protein
MIIDAVNVRATSRVTRQWLQVLAAVGLTGTPAIQVRAQALTLAEVVSLRTQGVSSRQIVRSAQQYCISFSMDDSTQKQLGAAGADSILLAGLRKACSNSGNPSGASTSSPSAIASAVGAPSTQPDVFFDDDFTRGGGRGDVGLVDRRCNTVADGTALHLENHTRDIVCVVGYPSGSLDDNVRIELTVRRLGASRQGVVILGFGRDPEVNGQYSFSVTADRRVELCRSYGGSCQRLIYKPGVSTIRAGANDENQLAIEIRGRRISLFVNGSEIDSYNAYRSVTGSLSLGFGPGTNVDVTHILARRLGGTYPVR